MTDFAEIEIDDKEIRKILSDIKKRSDEISERGKKFIGILSAVVYRDIIDHFDKGEGSEGSWKPWSPSYKKFMESIGKGGNKILQDTGRLRQSFIPTNVRAVSDGILWFNNAKTKNNFPYAFAHNTGGPKLPKRDFMWISNGALADIEQQVIKFLES